MASTAPQEVPGLAGGAPDGAGPAARRPRRPGMLDLGALRALVEAGTVDTVEVSLTDMQGRLQGKRLSA
ncbi:MAG: hypothetical protein ACRDSS_06435, partial [Actinocrinis sp.]